MRVILLLGAAVRDDGPSPALLNRADHAAALYRAGAADLILASGGGKGPTTEAEALRARLIERAVPDSAIVTEARSATTWENMTEARPLLDQVGAREIIIVTDRYHLPRARLAARRHGLRAKGSAAPPGTAPGWKRLRSALREIPAFVQYALRRNPDISP